MTKVLSVARAKDREAMALLIEETVKAHGGIAARVAAGLSGLREIRLEIRAANGLTCGLELDGDSRMDHGGEFCLPWFLRGNARMSDEFDRVAGSSVNPFHRQKCTAFANGFDDLLTKIAAVLDCVAAGEAFEKL
jgi:hypothetical protein